MTVVILLAAGVVSTVLSTVAMCEAIWHLDQKPAPVAIAAGVVAYLVVSLAVLVPALIVVIR